jgi:hypothetical protein
VLTKEKDFERLAAVARRVCWWEPADATLKYTPLFLCRVMVFGTWDDLCFVLDHYGKAAFREHYNRRLQVFLITARGITGITALHLLRSRRLRNVPSPHETAPGYSSCGTATLVA